MRVLFYPKSIWTCFRITIKRKDNKTQIQTYAAQKWKTSKTPEIRPLVACFWQMRAAHEGKPESLIPQVIWICGPECFFSKKKSAASIMCGAIVRRCLCVCVFVVISRVYVGSILWKKRREAVPLCCCVDTSFLPAASPTLQQGRTVQANLSKGYFCISKRTKTQVENNVSNLFLWFLLCSLIIWHWLWLLSKKRTASIYNNTYLCIFSFLCEMSQL